MINPQYKGNARLGHSSHNGAIYPLLFDNFSPSFNKSSPQWGQKFAMACAISRAHDGHCRCGSASADPQQAQNDSSAYTAEPHFLQAMMLACR